MRRIRKFLYAHPATMALGLVPLLGALVMFHS
jgi:hypothetical protein